MIQPVQLPDAEFEIMQIIWNNPVPITSGRVDELLKESLRGLMRAMYADKKPTDEEIAEIEQWFAEQ